MRLVIYIFFMSLLTLGCSEPENALYKEVMEIHDEVMPKTGTIAKYSRTLKKHLDDLPEDQKSTYQQTIKALDDAEEAMMDWMAEFDSSSEDSTYLLQEKARIQAVSDQMYASMAEAEKILKK